MAKRRIHFNDIERQIAAFALKPMGYLQSAPESRADQKNRLSARKRVRYFFAHGTVFGTIDRYDQAAGVTYGIAQTSAFFVCDSGGIAGVVLCAYVADGAGCLNTAMHLYSMSPCSQKRRGRLTKLAIAKNSDCRR